jgi:hypothetical protein
MVETIGVSDKEITLVSNDNQKMKVSMRIMDMSQFLKDAFEGMEDDDEDNLITELNKVDAEGLQMVIEYC